MQSRTLPTAPTPRHRAYPCDAHRRAIANASRCSGQHYLAAFFFSLSNTVRAFFLRCQVARLYLLTTDPTALIRLNSFCVTLPVISRVSIATALLFAHRCHLQLPPRRGERSSRRECHRLWDAATGEGLVRVCFLYSWPRRGQRTMAFWAKTDFPTRSPVRTTTDSPTEGVPNTLWDREARRGTGLGCAWTRWEGVRPRPGAQLRVQVCSAYQTDRSHLAYHDTGYASKP